ncbi:MAG: nucleotidyltransferase, partial [Gemmatimonadetes bacterium]|nr:nucleotidyltransferase [Gemmatimonadota bacterium]
GVTAAPPRRSPWGTGHAVLAAEPEIDGPFAVVNADDFYGRDAFAVVAEFLKLPIAPGPPAVFANVAYPLVETLSSAGGVSRAVCRVSGDGWLETVEEITDLRRRDDGAFAGVDPRGRPQRVGGDALVSMNLWAFTPAVFPILRRGFAEFLRQAGGEPGEFLIPHAIQDAVVRGDARVRLLRANSRWLGMTYPEDRPGVEAALRELVAAGEYPERLWP